MGRKIVMGQSVSTGTLREEDLIPTFWSLIPEARQAEIRAYSGYEALIDAVETGQLAGITEDEESGEFLEYLTDVLQDYAERGYYFGTIEGDGSDFGFWPHDDKAGE